MRLKSIIFITILAATTLLVVMWKTNKVDTVRAYGNLTVDLGVGMGEPIFIVDNFLPGECEIRNIVVTNQDTIPKDLAVRSSNESFTNSLPSVLNISIYDQQQNYYDKSLETFFADSQSVDGVFLSTINEGQTNQYSFKVCFDKNADNQFQNAQTVFDLIFGEVISPLQLPAECSHLKGIITQKIEGTSKKDKIRGTSASELIIGYGGNDELDGGAGSDCIVAGDGKDILDGGAGNDVVLGFGGNDTVEGGSGNDKLYGGDGKDKMEGGSGNDYINGGAGIDTIDGQSGRDTCQEGEKLNSCEL